jgi:hypothetical protein
MASLSDGALSTLPSTEKDYRYSYCSIVIGVSRQYSPNLETLLQNQRRAIDLSALYPVTDWRSDYLLGWPFNTPKLACAHLSIPPTKRDALKYHPISYAESKGYVVSGFFVVPNKELYNLPESRHSFFSSNDLITIAFTT